MTNAEPSVLQGEGMETIQIEFAELIAVVLLTAGITSTLIGIIFTVAMNRGRKNGKK